MSSLLRIFPFSLAVGIIFSLFFQVGKSYDISYVITSILISIIIGGIISMPIIFSPEIINFIIIPRIKQQLERRIWHSRKFERYIGNDLLNLYKDTKKLIKNFSRKGGLSDYSFLVLPMAKAYEGILKKILVQNKLIEEKEIRNNPSISINTFFNPKNNNKVVEALKDKARDKVIPYLIYTTYQECRNQIFHYDPYKDNRIDKEKALFLIERIKDAMVKSYETFGEVK